MLAARVTGTGRILRCLACDAPGDIALTDIAPSLRRDGRCTAVYCRNCAADVVRVVRSCAEVLRSASSAAEARAFAHEVEELLREVRSPWEV